MTFTTEIADGKKLYKIDGQTLISINLTNALLIKRMDEFFVKLQELSS